MKDELNVQCFQQNCTGFKTHPRNKPNQIEANDLQSI